MMLLSSLACLIFMLWIAARIWKSSAILAILTVFLWPAAVFALLRYWNDEESDIKVPFALFLVAAAYTWHQIFAAGAAVPPEARALLAGTLAAV